MTDDLRSLLQGMPVRPPYVLVGHSIGGFIVRLYSHSYPEDVAGVVLVDASHPDRWIKTLAILPESAGEDDRVRDYRNWLKLVVQPAATPEGMDVDASAAQVRATGTLGNRPLVVLSRSPDSKATLPLPALEAAKVEKVWQDLQLDQMTLSTASTHRFASRAGHNIPIEEPNVVVAAIEQVVGAVRRLRHKSSQDIRSDNVLVLWIN